MHKEQNDLLEEIEQMRKENSLLKSVLACYEGVFDSLAEIKSAKELLDAHSGQKAFSLFQKHFLEKDIVAEVIGLEDTISQFLAMHCNNAIKIKKKLMLLSGFEKLHMIYEKLSLPEVKLTLLLQMTGDGNAKSILDHIFEGKVNVSSASDLLEEYYDLVRTLSKYSLNKSAFCNEFTLEIVPDAPTTEKEQRKLEIRDNTIRNLYRKYGDKLFLPENMAVLWENLSKVGIRPELLSDSKIRQICRRL